jgi:hypothetical protein
MRKMISLAAFLLALPALSPAGDFDWLTREFERQSGVHQLHIPFFGLARFAVAVAHPAGVSSLQMAVFEHPRVAPQDFAKFADSAVGKTWKPIIHVRDQTGEITNIYAQPDGKHLKLIIATLDKDDAVLLQVRIRPEQLIKFVDEHKHHNRA